MLGYMVLLFAWLRLELPRRSGCRRVRVGAGLVQHSAALAPDAIWQGARMTMTLSMTSLSAHGLDLGRGERKPVSYSDRRSVPSCRVQGHAQHQRARTVEEIAVWPVALTLARRSRYRRRRRRRR